MPGTVNGIGTMYYGRSNEEQHAGICEQCNNETILRNYETKLWFTIVFIPIIPLGRKQILNDCSHCRRHYVLTPEQWAESQQAAIEESAQHMATNPDDPQSMASMHATLVACNRHDEAAELLTMLEARFADNVDVQMYLGSWYENQGNDARATEHFQHALKLEPDNPAPRRAVGIELMAKGQLNEARELFSALKPPSEYYDPLVWFLLAQAYQENQRPEEALEVYQLILAASPEVAKEKSFRQAVRVTEEALGREKSCVPKDHFFKSRGFVIGTLVTAALIGLVLLNGYIANHRDLYVVNGLPVPMTVRLNDDEDTVSLPAVSYRTVELPEGTHQVEIVKPESLAGPVEFSFSSGWFGRFFNTPAFVLDPSRTTAVTWEQTVYAENPRLADEADAKSKVHFGQPLTYYDDVDYLFEEFPESIQVKNNEQARRTRVAMYKGSAIDLLGMYGDNVSPAAESELLERLLLAAPDDTTVLSSYIYAANAADTMDQALDFLAAGLDERPLRVQWHRYYQSFLMRDNRTEELLKRYDAYLEKEPNNSHLLYLRGRLEPTADKSTAYFDRAIEADSKNWNAWAGKAFAQMARADFAGALRSLDKAKLINPEDEQITRQRRQTMLALERYGPVETALKKEIKEHALNLNAHLALMDLYCRTGREAEAEQAHNTYVAQLNASGLPGAEQYRSMSVMSLDYRKQDFQAFVNHSKESGIPQADKTAAVSAAIETNDPAKAAGIFDSGDVEVTSNWALELSIAWREKGNREEADKWRTTAIDLLMQEGPESVYVANLLKRSKEQPVTQAEVVDINMEPSQKALMLLALAENAVDREAMLSLAEKLNFARDFPYHFLRRSIEAARRQ